MKRALFISSRPIYPITGGDQIRTAQQLELLTELFDVDVLFISEKSAVEKVSSWVPSIRQEYNFVIPKLQSYLQTLKGFFKNAPLQISYYYSKNVQKWINNNISNYDVVFCNNIRTAEYVQQHHKVIRYLDFVDAISMNYEKARKKAGWLMKKIYNIDFHRCRIYEKKCLDAFDSCAVISEVDKNYLSEDATNLHLVGNYIDIPSNEEMCLHNGLPKFVFLGKMSYAPNILAVTYFAHNIFPKIREQYPNLEFIIVGANPTEQIKELSQIPGISVTGFVDSTLPYFQNAAVVIAPMQTGAGIQNKIIQAMAHGCCVATSPIGREGLDVYNDEIAIYKSSDEWINGLKHLLQHPEVRREMGLKAANYVLNNLSKQIISKQFKEFISID